MYKKIPMAKLLKGKPLKIARVQDLLIVELLKNFDFILHGGSAVWRVYGGKRFSFDIDIYHKDPKEVLNHFLSTKWFTVLRSKITPSKVLYLRLKEEEEVELEVFTMFREIKPVEGEFWLIDGGSVVVKTLSPEELVKEKINAFIDRRKSRDLYDIYYLLDLCGVDRVKDHLKMLLESLNEEPKDFEGLKDLILLGRVPEFSTIARKVERYAEG